MVMHEISHRSKYFKIDSEWYRRTYRGKNLPESSLIEIGIFVDNGNKLVYVEHNDRYLKECLLNLKLKGAELVNGETIDEMLLELDLKGVR